MTYLCINNIDDISLYNIIVKENIIQYKLNDIIINGLIIKCKIKLIENEDKYKLFIFNQKIKSIDDYLSNKINNYKSFLISETNDENNFYIELKKNNIITSLLKKYKTEDYYYLNIKYINKYNNIPIIYLI
tara:strand:- start:31 stop:423 length:393 start_codon:yes stop_codon:yes gene_type:complete